MFQLLPSSLSNIGSCSLWHSHRAGHSAGQSLHRPAHAGQPGHLPRAVGRVPGQCAVLVCLVVVLVVAERCLLLPLLLLLPPPTFSALAHCCASPRCLPACPRARPCPCPCLPSPPLRSCSARACRARASSRCTRPSCCRAPARAGRPSSTLTTWGARVAWRRAPSSTSRWPSAPTSGACTSWARCSARSTATRTATCASSRVWTWRWLSARATTRCSTCSTSSLCTCSRWGGAGRAGGR